MNRPAVLVLCALAMSAAACEDDATAPAGKPSTVSVRAYVDANGSGTFDAGDTPIPGLVISAVSTAGGDSLSATTDASGVATFTGVSAGSYHVRVTGNAPAGAVLATASAPILVAPILGGEVATEFRYTYNPGTVSGVLYRDNNANGQFDAGDTPAGGLTVRLFAGTDTTATPVATTSTDNAGAYTFTTIRPGSYTVLVTPFPTIQIVGGNAQAVTVAAAQTTTADARFNGNLVVPISEARANNPLDSVAVAIEGTVVAGTGTFNSRSFYVQDATGGILVFGVETGTSLQPGTRVRVVGKVVAFNQELEIVQPTVTVLGSAAVPAPRVVTGADINALRFQGELGKVSNVTVTAVSGGPTSTAYNVTVTDASGTPFVVRVANAGIGIPQPSWEIGGSYDVTGMLIRFNATGQLQPRSAADVQAATSAQSIASARANNPLDSATVTVEGIVTAGTGTFNARSFYVQDATGGILVFGVDTATIKPQPGDRVRITGKVVAFNQELEIVQPTVTKLGTAAVPAPRTVTGEDISGLRFQGELAKISNVTVTAVSGTATSSSYNVTATDAAGTSFVIRVANTGIGLPQPSWVVGNKYDVTGIMIRFNATGQLLVRSAADVTAR